MLSIVSFSCSGGPGVRLFYFVLSCSVGLAVAIMRMGYLPYLCPPRGLPFFIYLVVVVVWHHLLSLVTWLH